MRFLKFNTTKFDADFQRSISVETLVQTLSETLIE